MAGLFKTASELRAERLDEALQPAIATAGEGASDPLRAGLAKFGAGLAAGLGRQALGDPDTVAAGDITQGVDVTNAEQLRASAAELSAQGFQEEATKTLQLARSIETSSRAAAEAAEVDRRKLDAIKEPSDNQLRGAHNLFLFSQDAEGQPDEFGTFVQDIQAEEGNTIGKAGLSVMARQFSQVVNEIKVDLDSKGILAPQLEIERVLLENLKAGEVAEDGTWFGGLLGERTFNFGKMSEALGKSRKQVLSAFNEDSKNAAAAKPVETAPAQASTESPQVSPGVSSKEELFDRQGSVPREEKPILTKLNDPLPELRSDAEREMKQIQDELLRIGKNPGATETIIQLQRRLRQLENFRSQ